MDEPKKTRKVRSDKGVVRRNKLATLLDYDEFLKCYDEWRQGKLTILAMSQRLGVSLPTMSKKIKYVLENNGQVPSFWFKKDGRNLEDILREQKIAELMEQQKAEQQNGNE